jgi:hypothetical protein
MFGLKKFKEAKSRSFANEKERKKYFAIKEYYKNKNNEQVNKKKKK